MSTRLDRMQKGLYTVLSNEIPGTTVQWSYQQPSFEQLESDVINLSLANGPSKVYVTHSRGGQVIFPPSLITLSIPNAVAGSIYIIELNYFTYRYEAQVGDTVEDIRAALIALINSDENDPYTAANTVNPGEFTITPSELGSIFQGNISNNLSIINIVLSDTPVQIIKGDRQAVIQIQTFSKSPNPRDGAWSIMEKIQDITEIRDLNNLLWDMYGIRIINFGVVADISAIAGASWESRCSADMTINLDSFLVRPVDYIEALNFNLETKAPGEQTSWNDSLSI